ncbi:GNAT family N-acetyltransferase [Nocardioides oleivorans]|uniref:GNAT family N-acetyltransferase n=1 Tax=Nocardioides oleivorans TaxID=273676 RepID=A0A4V1RL25_9ACTN|nr:GNAT family N-acetyltransferase [Nocardioides oleivorans]RYB94302.1 GNAT family N-acetyltransferase [Nocardioides oleivorans]
MTAPRIEVPGSAEWHRLWEATGREPFAHPSYLGLTAGPGERVVGVCWSDAGGEVLLPLLLRPLPSGPGLQDLEGDWTDAVSPYGYGGPFVTGEPDLAAFFAALRGWMRDEHVLTGFVRASLGVRLPPDDVAGGYEAVHLTDNVVVSLDREPEDRWQHYDRKVRKNVNKARRHDLRVEVRDDFGDVAEFVSVYHGTMDRRGADGRYWFDAAYFEGIRDRLAGSYWVADVRDLEGRVVSTELVLRSDTRCYSFLGGTHADAFPMAPNDLLKHAVIDHAAGSGLTGYVLGGGYQPGDGIFRYKRAFDPDGVVAFHGVRLTSSTDTYERLRALRPDVDPRFFPAYRSP